MFRLRFKVLATAVVFLFLVFGALSGWTYTQSGAGTIFSNTVPMGHEWITRMAAVELLGYSPAVAPDVRDPQDPRKTWTQGLAKNLNLSSATAQAEVRRIKSLTSFIDDRYVSRYKPIYDAIIGERWVDIAGYNIVAGKMAIDCWDAVAQEPVEIQYDHFMRRYDDRNALGGMNSAVNSQQRFTNYFVAAAMAPHATMLVYDGGAADSTAVQVDRNYFLLGRAIHMFEDSFSSEHTVRRPDDNYTRIRQVKSYLCAPGSEQHSHSIPAVLNYSSGDVIWNSGTRFDPTWLTYKASNMKTSALVATEATKDLWAAFIRTMGTPIAQREGVARLEATKLSISWLSFNQSELMAWYNDESHRDATYVLAQGETGKGTTVKACMAGLNVGTDDQQTFVRQLEATQRKCLYNAIPWPGYDDLYDTSLHMYYTWRWKDRSAYLDPPNGWKVPVIAADTGVQVRIKSVANNQYMSAPDGLTPDSLVYVKSGQTPLDFTLVGTKDNGVLRVAAAPLLFLSYRAVTGAVKLYDPGATLDPTDYKLSPAGQGWSIYNLYWKQYMYLSNYYQSPYIDSNGNPSNANGQWYIDGLPR